MWTGGVRSLLDAFKAFSKTCLINTQEAVEPQADSVSSDGGLSGRCSVTKTRKAMQDDIFHSCALAAYIDCLPMDETHMERSKRLAYFYYEQCKKDIDLDKTDC